jgi:hypothetical protein
MDQLTDFHEIWYELYATKGHPNQVELVITAWHGMT